MPDRLILRPTLVDTAKTAHRLVADRLVRLRGDAIAVDNYDAVTNMFDMKPPIHFTSVEVLVMEVSDLAQACGYLSALIERNTDGTK